MWYRFLYKKKPSFDIDVHGRVERLFCGIFQAVVLRHYTSVADQNIQATEFIHRLLNDTPPHLRFCYVSLNC
ncbi:tropinone reductase-like 3 [Biomphalaria glabrata]